MRPHRLALVLLAAASLAACTVLRPLPLSGSAHVEFIGDDWCMITMPERTGRPEALKLENPYVLLAGGHELSIGLYSDSHRLAARHRFYAGDELLFEHDVEGVQQVTSALQGFSVGFCYETELATGETHRVECELGADEPDMHFQRLALSDRERDALIGAFAPDRPARLLEIRSLRTVRRFSVPPEAHAYLLDPNAACREMAARSTPYEW